MSDTKKAGKHPGRNIKNPPKPDGDAKLLEPILSRHTYGHTEKKFFAKIEKSGLVF